MDRNVDAPAYRELEMACSRKGALCVGLQLMCDDGQMKRQGGGVRGASSLKGIFMRVSNLRRHAFQHMDFIVPLGCVSKYTSLSDVFKILYEYCAVFERTLTMYHGGLRQGVLVGGGLTSTLCDTPELRAITRQMGHGGKYGKSHLMLISLSKLKLGTFPSREWVAQHVRSVSTLRHCNRILKRTEGTITQQVRRSHTRPIPCSCSPSSFPMLTRASCHSSQGGAQEVRVQAVSEALDV